MAAPITNSEKLLNRSKPTDQDRGNPQNQRATSAHDRGTQELDPEAGPLTLVVQSTISQPSARDDKITKIAKRNRDADCLKEKEDKSRDPRKGYPENILIYIPPEPDYNKYKPKKLSESEVRYRRNLISRAVTNSTAINVLPMACRNLRQWLQGIIKIRVFSEKELPWDSDNLNIKGGLHAKGRSGESHISALSKGILRRSNPQDKNFVPPNKKNVLYYQNSMVTEDELMLKILRNPKSKLPDAFFALGAFMLNSELVYHVTSIKATSISIVIDRWRCQIYDTYDWDITPPYYPPGKLERRVFFFCTESELQKTNFRTRYSNYIIGDIEDVTIAKLASTYLKQITGEDISVVPVDVNFFIELEISGSRPRPHWFDVFSEIVDITKWKDEILFYIRDDLGR